MDHIDDNLMDKLDDEMRDILERLAGLLDRGVVSADELQEDFAAVMNNFKEEHNINT